MRKKLFTVFDNHHLPTHANPASNTYTVDESLTKPSRYDGVTLGKDVKLTAKPVKLTPGVGDYNVTSKIPTLAEFKILL